MTATDTEALLSNISSQVAQLKKRKAKKAITDRVKITKGTGAEGAHRGNRQKTDKSQPPNKDILVKVKRKRKLLHNVKMENLHDKEK